MLGCDVSGPVYLVCAGVCEETLIYFNGSIEARLNRAVGDVGRVQWALTDSVVVLTDCACVGRRTHGRHCAMRAYTATVSLVCWLHNPFCCGKTTACCGCRVSRRRLSM